MTTSTDPKVRVLPQRSKKYPTIASQGTANKHLRLTLDAYFDWWISNHAGEFNTTQSYRAMYEVHISPYIGELQVSKVTAVVFDKVMEDLAKDPGPRGFRSGSLMNRIAKTMRYMYAPLERWGVANPARNAGGYMEDRKQPRVLELGDEQALLDALPNEGARCLVETIWETGCRVGEAIALTPSDFSTPTDKMGDRSAVSISKSVYWTDSNTAQVKHTKKAQARTSSISADLFNRLEELVSEHDIGPGDPLFQEAWCAPDRVRPDMFQRNDSWTSEDLASYLTTAEPVRDGSTVLHGTTSGYTMGCRCDACGTAIRLHRRSERERINAPRASKQRRDPRMRHKQVRDLIAKASRDAGLGHMTTHWLRHTRVTHLVEAGLTYKQVGSITGQEQKTIENIYEHQTNRAQERIMSAMNLGQNQDDSVPVLTPAPIAESSGTFKFCPTDGTPRGDSKFCPECGLKY